MCFKFFFSCCSQNQSNKLKQNFCKKIITKLKEHLTCYCSQQRDIFQKLFDSQSINQPLLQQLINIKFEDDYEQFSVLDEQQSESLTNLIAQAVISSLLNFHSLSSSPSKAADLATAKTIFLNNFESSDGDNIDLPKLECEIVRLLRTSDENIFENVSTAFFPHAATLNTRLMPHSASYSHSLSINSSH